MELWVRSQDKLDLIKCTSIHIEEVPGVDEVAIKTFNYGDKYTYVGYYETKERALEVLNEIQKIVGWIQKDMKYTTIGEVNHLIGCYDNYVYEMPEK